MVELANEDICADSEETTWSLSVLFPKSELLTGDEKFKFTDSSMALSTGPTPRPIANLAPAATILVGFTLG